MRARSGKRFAAGVSASGPATALATAPAIALASALFASPAPAQEGPIGPCSPYRAADGDIPSDMPGCARHRRPAPGSLDDELAFRRARRGVEADDGADEDPPRIVRRRGRTGQR